MNVFVPVDKYVTFDETGNLQGIYNRQPENENFIKVDPSDVETLVSGKEQFRHYLVVFDKTKKQHVLKHIYNEENYLDNINDQIFRIPTNNKENPDLVVIQDIKNKQWRFKIDNQIKLNFENNNLNFNQPMGFSITRKNNPNHLERFVVVDVTSILDSTYSIDFEDELELDPTALSVYTAKRLESYYHEVLQ